MMMYPTLEQVRTIAASGDYWRIPVCREVLADRFTPVEVMRTLRAASRHCYLLESAASDHRWGRYSFLGYSPTLEVTCQDGTLRIRRVDEDGVRSETVSPTDHPGQAIREILQRYHKCRPSPAGWWGISPTTISSTPSPRCAWAAKVRTSAMWT